MNKGLTGIAALAVGLVVLVYLLMPSAAPGEWQSIDPAASELYFAGDGNKEYWRTGWFRDEQSHRVLGWREGLEYPRFAVYLRRRPYGQVYWGLPAPAELFGLHPLFDAGFEILGEERRHDGRLLARYVAARARGLECLAFVGAERGDAPGGELADLNRYLAGYFCAEPGAKLDDGGIRAALDAVGIKKPGDPVPAPPGGATSG